MIHCRENQHTHHHSTLTKRTHRSSVPIPQTVPALLSLLHSASKMAKNEHTSLAMKISPEFCFRCRNLWLLNGGGWGKGGYLAYLAGSVEHKHTQTHAVFGNVVNCMLFGPPSRKPLPLNHAQYGAYFLLLKLLLWLFVRDEGEIFGKAERLEAPDDLQKIKNIMS